MPLGKYSRVNKSGKYGIPSELLQIGSEILGGLATQTNRAHLTAEENAVQI
jgi:hypothetical protein